MSAINRQASGFSSEKEEGAHRGISTDTLQRTETAFARYTSLEKNVRRFARCIPSPEAPGYQYSPSNTMYTVSHHVFVKSAFRVELSRVIASSVLCY